MGRHVFGFFAAAAFAGTLALAGPARAHEGWHGGGPGGEGMEVLHTLNLSDAQKGQIHSILEAEHAQSHAQWEQLRALHHQLAQKLLTAGTTEADLKPILDQSNAIRDQLAEQHLVTALAIRNLLTPEQLSEAAAKQSKIEALHAAERRVVGDR